MFGIGPIWSLMIGPRIWSSKMRPRQRHSVIADQPRARGRHRRDLLVRRPGGLAARADADRDPRRHRWASGCSTSSTSSRTSTGRARERWSYADAALRGSSYLKLPKLLPVLHRQHRPAPRPPPQRQGPQLQPPARPRRERDLPRRPGADHSRRAARDPAQGDRPAERPAADLEPRSGPTAPSRRCRRRWRPNSLSRPLNQPFGVVGRLAAVRRSDLARSYRLQRQQLRRRRHDEPAQRHGRLER